MTASARHDNGAPAQAPRLRWTAAGIAVAVTVIAIYLPKLPFTTPYTPRFAGIMIAAAAWAWAWALAPQRFRADRRVLLAAGVIAAVTLISSATSALPGAALTWGAEDGLMGAPTWIALLAVFAASSAVVLGREVRTALSFAYIWALPVALTVLLDSLRGTWISAGFGNPNFAGAVLVPFVPLALYLARETDDDRVQAGWQVAAGTCATAVLFCGSLAPVGGLAVAMGVLAVVAPQLIGGEKRARLVRGTGFGVLAAAAVVAVMVVVSLATPQLPAIRHALGPTAETRVEMWKVATAVFAEHPILGVGPDGLQLASQGQMTERLLALEPGKYTDYRVLLRDPHSLPALAVASVGVIGVLALLGLAVVWVLALRRRLAQPGAGAAWRWALASGLAGLIASLLFMPWPIVFGGLVPLLAGLAIAPAPARGDEPAAGSGAPAALRWSAVVVATAAAIALPGLAVAGDAAMVSAQRAGDALGAAAAYERAQSQQPTRSYPAYEALFARGFALAGQDPATYRTLVDSAPDGVRANGAYLANLVQPLLDAAWPPDGRDLSWEGATLERAAKLAPLHPDVLLERAHLAALESRFDDAEDLLARAEAVGASESARYALYAFFASDPRQGDAAAEKAASELATRYPEIAAYVSLRSAEASATTP